MVSVQAMALHHLLHMAHILQHFGYFPCFARPPRPWARVAKGVIKEFAECDHPSSTEECDAVSIES